MTHVIEPNAAGIDVGSTEMFVAVPVDRDPQPVRRFTTFTRDLVALADWLKQCGITSVAMESTGVFWIPLFQLLEDRGFRVCLVNARHAKNVPGRKTDVADCQWLQYLHSVGLLRASHRPAQSICAIRSLWRHRESLVQIAAHHTQHMQKALDQMNIQLHHVISDITGVTGLAIIDAILGGERNPKKITKLRNAGIKASEQTVAEALVGDYRSEHLFVLRQSLEAYRQYQRWITDCDHEIEKQLHRIESKIDPVQHPLVRTKKDRRKPRGNEARFDLRNDLYRIFGVDLTDVPGVSSLTAHLLLTEVGADLSKFPSAAAFASWLGLCPDNRISGGKILSAATRHVVSRLAIALRLGAQSLYTSRSCLGDTSGSPSRARSPGPRGHHPRDRCCAWRRARRSACRRSRLVSPIHRSTTSTWRRRPGRVGRTCRCDSSWRSCSSCCTAGDWGRSTSRARRWGHTHRVRAMARRW